MKYAGEEGVFSAISRRLEIFGAEMYHSYFGASMSGMVIDDYGQEAAESTYDQVAKKLGASPLVKRFGSLVLGTAFLHQMVTSGFFGIFEFSKVEYF